MAQSPEQTSRNRSISAGASELPQHEHKRPRLDISATTDAMPQVMPADSRFVPTNSSDARSSTPPPTTTPCETSKGIVSPTSKVTINTRPLSAQSITHDNASPSTANGIHAAKQPEETILESTAESLVNISDAEPANIGPGHAAEPISISSSPEPTIEIGEPEDIDDEVGTLVLDTPEEPRLPSAWESFPFQSNNSRVGVVATVMKVADMFEKGGTNDEQFLDIFNTVIRWMKDLPPSILRRSLQQVSDDLEIIQQLPILASSILKRKIAFPSDISEVDVLDFFNAFAHVAMSMINFDSRWSMAGAGLQTQGQQSWYLSYNFIKMLSLMVMPDASVTLHKALRQSRGSQSHELCFHTTAALLEHDPMRPFQALSELFGALSTAVPSTSPARAFVLSMPQYYRSFLSAINGYRIPLDAQRSESLRQTTSSFVLKVNEAVNLAIKKQQPWLTIENNEICVANSCRLVNVAIIMFPELAERVFNEACVEHLDVDALYVADTAELAYKLLLFKQFIRYGRMELRVSGIEKMAAELVRSWMSITKGDRQQIPLLALIVAFLRNNDMVKYILGVDCHPQIVHRSANVIGFLCVSDHWNSADSDIAWQAILQSQDHRSVTAVIETLRTNLQHLRLDALLYMYDKLYEVPFETYDHRMLDFTCELLNTTMQKVSGYSTRKMQVNATMAKLCLYLLQEVNIPPRCDTDLAEQIRDQLSRLMASDRSRLNVCPVMDVSESDRSALIQTIVTNISQHTDRATGGIIVMTILLQSLTVTAAEAAITTSDYIRLLLDDIVHLSRHDQNNSAHSEKTLSIEYQVRLLGLRDLILSHARLFDAATNHSLWNDILASEKADLRRAWAILADGFRKVGENNSVLGYAVAQFMDHLPPSLYDAEVLEFCKASVLFEIRHEIKKEVSTDDCLQIPSMERIWRVMLDAPEDAVKDDASEFIIGTYLDEELLRNKSTQCIRTTHAMLVNRCIQTVIESAQGLHSAETGNLEPMDSHTLVQTKTSVDRTHELHIYRSLTLLTKFLNSLKTRTYFKPTPSESLGPVLETFQRQGEPTDFQVRVQNHPEMRTGQFTFTVGRGNKGHELWEFLTKATGWSQITLIKAGARLQWQNDDTLVKDMKLGVGPVLISKPMGLPEAASRGVRASSPVDSTIMHHFDELYALLESRESIAKAVYDFLAIYSSQGTVVAEIKGMSMPADSLLPVRKPFKLLYYANALRACIEEESYSPSPNADFLKYAVRTILTTLTQLDSINKEQSMYLSILSGIIETLQLALRAKVPESVSVMYLEDPKLFVANVLGAWNFVQHLGMTNGGSLHANNMDRDFLDVLIEASLHEPRVWHHLDDDTSFDRLFSHALLLNSNVEDRIGVYEVITKLAGVPPGKLTLKADDTRSPRIRFGIGKLNHCLQQVWKYLRPLIAQACCLPAKCQQAMEASVAVYTTVSKLMNSEILLDLSKDIKVLLLGLHNPKRRIYCPNEVLIFGLAKMLNQTVSVLVSLQVTMPDAQYLIKQIYQQLLFPPLSASASACLKEQSLPIIYVDARTALYTLIASLCQTPSELATVAAEITESAIDKDAFTLHVMNERKALRSEQGYAGLRNLSNTCYLNSLFSQLFMNVKFRELVIGINVVDESKQKLVRELGNVFANMQSSYEKFADPEEAVGSMTQYTGEEIDVTVQMDVDEFFNLLFDRLEAQILDPGAREAFKSMYGGQLVQQIKSKECEHVSERLEPFSAVQIEIKGKSGLEEGLAAYVEGEVLQGENKYSCTGCGRHVDAVKRACFKEIPDNLIFNLKRFDYEIMTGMRCKVNDEFQFPERIDMQPYTIDALGNDKHQLSPDMFELVGVIIHSGTAETGHYYSYVRQRPSSRHSKDSWLQFNDVDVSSFDPSQMRDQAFGGCDATFNNFARFYNGYMLFYQRTSSIQAYEQDYAFSNDRNAVTVCLPQGIDNRIAQENEICLRRYVAQDPSHAKFVREVLLKLRLINTSCSSQHDLEDCVLSLVLEYLHQVSSRWKEGPDFEDTMNILTEYAKQCPRCALKIVEWFNSERNVTSTILRSYYMLARKNFAILLYSCFSALSPFRHSDNKEADRQRLVNALTGCMKQAVEDWSVLQRQNRSWDHFFELWIAISRISVQEAHAMLELEFLAKVAEIIWIQYGAGMKSTPRGIKQNYSTYLAAKEKNRPFSHAFVLDLFAELLQYVTLSERSVQVNRDCLEISDKERKILCLEDDNTFEWLRRLIAGGHNPEAADKVVKELCGYPGLLKKVSYTLVEGIDARQYTIGCRFLRPCMAFIEFCTERKHTAFVLKRGVASVSESAGYHSSEYFAFVWGLTQIETSPTLTSADIQLQLSHHMIGDWAPALLMGSNDIGNDVRTAARSLLQQIFFDRFEQFDQHVNIDALRILVQSCIDYISKNYLGDGRGVISANQTREIVAVLEQCARTLSEGADTEDEVMTGDIEMTVQQLNALEGACDVDELADWREASSELQSDIESFDTSP